MTVTTARPQYVIAPGPASGTGQARETSLASGTPLAELLLYYLPSDLGSDLEPKMYFQQFYLESLGHASYLVGSDQTGEALVFDARRDVDAYLIAARAQGIRIAYAADSHQHNDYLSGIRELAARGEVTLFGSAAAATATARGYWPTAPASK